LRSGWPDFLLIDPVTHAVLLLEVKGPADSVNREQREMLDVLTRCGLPTGLMRYACTDKQPKVVTQIAQSADGLEWYAAFIGGELRRHFDERAAGPVIGVARRPLERYAFD
jgi:hypothetical protein